VALYRACLEAPLPVPRELRADLPEGVEEIILGLLVRDPGARFQTAEQVLERLDGLDPALTDRVLGRKQLATWVNDVRKTMSDEAAFSPTPSANVADGQTATMTHDLRATRSTKPDGT
jgi:hypothetical protein